MAPTIDDLRHTLSDLAEEHPAPSPHDLLTGLRRERRRRRTRTLGLAGAGVAAAAAAAVVLGQGVLDQQSAPGPAGHGTGSDGDLATRGWVLEDGQPPEHADGLRLVSTDQLTRARDGQVVSPAGEGPQRFVVAWCDLGPAQDDPAVQPAALTLPALDLTVPCLPRDRAPARVDPVPLPPATGQDQAWEVGWEGDLPRGADAVVAVYEEAGRGDYPFGERPDPALTAPPPPEGSTVLDPATPRASVQAPEQRAAQRGEGTIPAGRELPTSSVVLGPDSALELWAGGPGTLRVLVDGVWVTDDGDAGPSRGRQSWRDQEPDLRDRGWQAYTFGQRRTLALPADLLPADGESRRVEVAVDPVMGTYDWRVAVTGTHDESSAEPLAPLPDTGPDAQDLPETLPEWVGGRHRAATWELPADGGLRLLEIPEELQGREVAWALVCPGGVPSQAPGRVVLGGQTVAEPFCPAPTDAATPGPTMLTDLGLDGDPPATLEGPVLVALPPSGDGAPGLAAAYLQVPFEEFDHAAAETPGDYDAEDRFPEGIEVEGALTGEDLAGGVTGSLPTTGRTMGVQITTEGVGRVHIGVNGEPVDWAHTAPELRDGWWTAWTDQRVTSLVLGSLDHALDEGDVLEFRVEGYEPGEVRIETFTVGAG